MDKRNIRGLLRRKGVIHVPGVSAAASSFEGVADTVQKRMCAEWVKYGNEQGAVAAGCGKHDASTMEERSHIGSNIAIPSLKRRVAQRFTAPQEFV